MPIAANKNNSLLYAAGDVIIWAGKPNITPPVTGIEDPGTLTSGSQDYRCCGWVDTSGYLFKLDASTKDIPAAGTLSAIRTIITGGSKTIQATFLEALNPYVLALYDDVPMFPVTTSKIKPAAGTVGIYTIPDPPGDNRYGMIFDSTDGSKRMRLYAPNVKVTARGDFQAQQADVTSVQMTFTMYPGTIGADTAAVAQRFVDFGATMTDYFTART